MTEIGQTEGDIPLATTNARQHDGVAMNSLKRAQSNAIISELDAIAADALLAFEQKDAIKFMSFYADDLEYTQGDGRTITRSQLLNDVRHQLKTIRSCKSTWQRRSLNLAAIP